MDSSRTDRYYREDDLQLFDQLSLQISAAIEMANSFEQTTRRAEREKRTGEITGRIRETLDIDVILRTAAQEVRQLLDVPEVIVQLVSPEEETDESA
jgi:GAF domain-containing protein